MSSWTKYKISIGYTIWDSAVVLPDLEETMSWCWAVSDCNFAEKLQGITERQAELGLFVSWDRRGNPVIVRQVPYSPEEF